jgi:translation initiation factor IF-3
MMSAQADPPVCKIMDYGKFCFDRNKKEKEARKKQKVIEVKEIQLTCLIDTNDFNTKVNHARRFLSDGNKVKVMVKFKGRQMSRQEVGKELLERFKEACSDLGAPEKAPILEGRNMIMFIAPLKTTGAK